MSFILDTSSLSDVSNLKDVFLCFSEGLTLCNEPFECGLMNELLNPEFILCVLDVLIDCLD